MKVKGKNKNETKVKVETLPDMPGKPSHLALPDISRCQAYLSGIKKEGSGVAFKDLIHLQNELEYMYVNITKRQEQLKAEIASVENPAAKKKRSKSTDSVGKKSGKKSKKGNGKKASTPSRSKNKFIQPPPKTFECGVTDAQMEMPKPQKNDGPTRFWTFIEPYCADITTEDIKSIEAWIQSHEEDSKYQNIPELGSHYTDKWAEDDFEEEVKEGVKSVENQGGYLNADSVITEKERLRKLGEEEWKKMELTSNSSQDSTLVDRLVSTFVQDNIMTPLDVCLTESSKDELTAQDRKRKASISSSQSPTKQSLEEKLCRGLSEIGAMEMEEPDPNDYSEDEILAELKRLQKALIPVSNRNLRHKKHLLASAKIDMERQAGKKKLKEIDAKAMEIYRAIYAARAENKSPPKKYVAQIKKTLSDRQKIIEELDSMS